MPFSKWCLSACPMNTYKANSSSCIRCPSHSSTPGTGNSLQGCSCNTGFSGPPGGPCRGQQDIVFHTKLMKMLFTDIDECSRGAGCAQTCVNTAGSYKCICTLPGYIQDADDHTNCLSKHSFHRCLISLKNLSFFQGKTLVLISLLLAMEALCVLRREGPVP